MVGYLFPGSRATAEAAATKYQDVDARKAAAEAERPMTLLVQPIQPYGQFDIDFSQDLISPAGLPDQGIYNGAFEINVESTDDGSEIAGSFGSSAAQRRLAALEVDPDSDASRLSFLPRVTRHDARALSMNLTFDDPAFLGFGSKARLDIQVV